MLICEPKNARGILAGCGYAWEPGTRLLVKFVSKNKVQEALAFFGKGINPTYYKVK